jgi:hypothetical protein
MFKKSALSSTFFTLCLLQSTITHSFSLPDQLSFNREQTRCIYWCSGLLAIAGIITTLYLRFYTQPTDEQIITSSKNTLIQVDDAMQRFHVFFEKSLLMKDEELIQTICDTLYYEYYPIIAFYESLITDTHAYMRIIKKNLATLDKRKKQLYQQTQAEVDRSTIATLTQLEQEGIAMLARIQEVVPFRQSLALRLEPTYHYWCRIKQTQEILSDSSSDYPEDSFVTNKPKKENDWVSQKQEDTMSKKEDVKKEDIHEKSNPVDDYYEYNLFTRLDF